MTKGATQRLLATLHALIFFGLIHAVSAQAQQFSLDSDAVAVVGASSPIDVGWTFATGGDMTGFQVTIAYDPSVFTADLTNCLAGASLDYQACLSPSSGVIGLTFFEGTGLPDLSGVIRFVPTSPSALVSGAQYALTVQQPAGQKTPATATLSISNGNITSSSQSVPIPILNSGWVFLLALLAAIAGVYRARSVLAQ